ncbi:MAG: sodium:proton antiporter [Microcystis wesenbergii Mw_QC_S_20081001_S30D]|jgi:NhaP-type Na+/H+ or K+/H+ antiporter|uniref:Sodium:proton antiporter n=1 Tax=Microcystis wesenbergii Mw_QC_S_20081001_S30D TaxID=2486245 RepID=A0A552K0J0_9CHRO|nr:sodium:proton antiporter [Microcystis aeruginosa W11-03]NCR95937.1 sodium:proton antiporter [Microcystis aeruginosa W11-06]TRU96358.1 MAG: sodium:proton antiporter [Microcystis wesenbergii Mw_QC_S_20081001_S30]TRU96421.1 MAG: sodium:proton antiporter [Microcystis wesenbergii Mw_QC_B_20070930_S4D]TRV01551.1 MAG: sodium:proton antiporter [Microcystis wesenbergii Mw_QC_S_20081001_S30D]TRV10814.1 MAG: sodium:proton antiporter [Microcystis wesenbergii Mw_QC_B_20070930_S4]
MDPSFALTLQIVITVVAGITAQVIAEYLKVPSIVFLLIFGIALGSDGWEILQPQSLGIGLEVLVALSVAIILFEGGLSLSGRELGRVSGSLRNLVTLGTSITLMGGGMAAHWLGEFPWPIAFLYASLVVVTGPTVIGPLLKQVAVDRRVATLLEGEGVLIDPVGAILAVVVLNTIIDSHSRPMEIITGLTLRLGIGAAIGIAGGGLLSFIIKTCNFLTFELKNLVVLAGVWGLFGLSQFSRSESGLMAVVMAGIVLKAAAVPDERLLRRFKGQLTTLCVSVLFILLAADLSIASVIALGWGSVLTVLVLMLVVRPLSVALCTLKSDLNWRHKLFIAWVAPRGIVSASVASLFAILLTRAGINGGEAIKALVFLTILMTVFIQGLTARWVAKGLKITSSAATGAVIVGCNPLGRLIGCLFQEQGENVVLIDTDARACQQAKEEGLTVLQSSGLDTKILQEAGIESMGTFLVLTNNSEVNLVLAQRASEEFHPPRVLAAFAGTPNPDKNKVNQVFLPSFSVKEWNQYLDDNQIKLGKTIFKGNDLSEQQTRLTKLIENGELLPLLLRRDNSLQVVTEREEWRTGDELIYILRDLRPQLLKRLSGTFRTRLSLEILPEVEIATSR